MLEAFTYRTNLLTHVADTGDVGRDLHSYLVALTKCLDEGETASTVANLLGEAIHSSEFAGLHRQTLLRDRREGFLTVLQRGREGGRSGRTLTSKQWSTPYTAPPTTGSWPRGRSAMALSFATLMPPFVTRLWAHPTAMRFRDRLRVGR